MVKQIHIIYKEHTVCNMQKKYQGVICTQRYAAESQDIIGMCD